MLQYSFHIFNVTNTTEITRTNISHVIFFFYIRHFSLESLSRLNFPRCDCSNWKTITTLMYRVGGSRETRYSCLKIANIYTLTKIKPTIIIKQPQIYTTSTSLSTHKNKRNFSTIPSRVRASPSRSHCRCRIPGQQERKDRRLIRNFSGHHHQTAAAVATATPMSKMKRSRHHW